MYNGQLQQLTLNVKKRYSHKEILSVAKIEDQQVRLFWMKTEAEGPFRIRSNCLRTVLQRMITTKDAYFIASEKLKPVLDFDSDMEKRIAEGIDVEPECIVDFLDVERRVFVPVDRFDEAHAFIVKAIVQEDGREMSLQITDEDNQVLDSSQIADTLRFLCETSKITKAAPTVRLKATVILVIGDHTVDAGQELNGVNADLEAFVLDDAEGQRAVSNLPSALNEAVTTTDQPLISLKDGRQESVERLEQEFSAMNTLDNSSSATSMGLPDQVIGKEVWFMIKAENSHVSVKIAPHLTLEQQLRNAAAHNDSKLPARLSYNRGRIHAENETQLIAMLLASSENPIVIFVSEPTEQAGTGSPFTTGRRTSPTVLTDEFLTPYTWDVDDEPSPIESVLEYVDQLVASGGSHYHMGTLINSSGTGKTRLAREIIQNRRAVYVGLSMGHEGSALLSSVHEYNNIFLSLLRHPPEEREKLAAKIIFAFASAAGAYSAEQLADMQFGTQASFHEKVWMIWKDIIEAGSTPLKVKDLLNGNGTNSANIERVSGVDTKATPKSVHGELAVEPKKAKSVSIHVGGFDTDCMADLLIIVDEAAVLTTEEDPDSVDTPLRVLRRIVTKFPKCYLLLLSTSSHVRDLNPSTVGSRAVPDHKCVPPFHKITHMAHYCKRSFHPLSFGRPLWPSKFRNATLDKAFFINLIGDASKMLFGSRTISNDQPVAEDYLALFGVRFSLSAFGTVANNLVKSHMGVIHKIVEETHGEDTCFITTAQYAPEPLLAEVACLRMAFPLPRTVQIPNQGEIGLAHVLKQVEKNLMFSNSTGLVDVGESGEVFAGVIFATVLDYLKAFRLRSNYDGDRLSFTGLEIPATEFFGQFTELTAEVDRGLGRYLVKFTHFQRRQTVDLLSLDYVASLYHRACAIYCRKNFEGTDILIPMRLAGSSKYILAAVQVNCYSKVIATSSVESIINKIKLNKLVTGWTATEARDYMHVDLVRILASVGRGGISNYCLFKRPKARRNNNNVSTEPITIDLSMDMYNERPKRFCMESWTVVQRLLERSEPSKSKIMDRIVVLPCVKDEHDTIVDYNVGEDGDGSDGPATGPVMDMVTMTYDPFQRRNKAGFAEKFRSQMSQV